MATLREFAQATKALNPHAPFRFVRRIRPSARARSWYVVDFGHGEIALEKGQVELVLLGLAAGLAVAGVIAHDQIKTWVDQLVAVFDDDQVPSPWKD